MSLELKIAKSPASSTRDLELKADETRLGVDGFADFPVVPIHDDIETPVQERL